MNCEQFFCVVLGFDEDCLWKVLWNFYWCGIVNMWECIEVELVSVGCVCLVCKIKLLVDLDIVGWEVDEFVLLVWLGVYLGGDWWVLLWE